VPGEAGVGETLVHSPKGRMGGHHQGAALVALGDHLEDQLRGAVGQGQVPQLVEDHQLRAGIAADHPAGLPPRLRFLQLVGQAGEG
jgi:hypothetical protein